MRNLTRCVLCSVVVLACAATSVFAGSVFVLPASQSDTSVAVFSDSPFQSTTTLATPAGAVAVLAKPDGSKYYVVSKSGTGTIKVFGPSFALLKSVDLGTPARAAVMSPDGKRLLVLADVLRVFDLTTADDAEMTLSPVPDVGLTPSDLVVGVDSKSAFILSTTSGTVTMFDLAANKTVGTPVPVSGSTAIAAAPNGQIYVSAQNSLYEIDGNTGLQRAQILLNGLPGKAVFTLDGNYALLPNQPPFIVTGLAILVDLNARSVAGVLSPLGSNAGQVLSQLAAADNSTFYGISTTTQQVIRVTLNAADTVNPLTLATTGVLLASKSGVRATAVSKELPAAKYFYAVTSTSLSQGVFASSQTQDLSQAVVPGVLQLAGPASTAAPTGVTKINDLQTVIAGATLQPLIVRLWDANGLPVFGKTVTFSTDVDGVTIETPSPLTTSDGYASTRITVPSAPGIPISVTASPDGWTGSSIIFTVSVGGGETGGGGGGTPTVGALSMYSGNGQVIVAGSSTTYPLRVRLTDASGQPLLGVTIGWSVTSGPGTVAESSETDSDGIAEMSFSALLVDPTLAYAQSTVSAQLQGFGPIHFTITVAKNAFSKPTGSLVSPPITNLSLTGQTGQTLAGGVQVRVTDFALGGVGVPNVGVSLLSDLDAETNPSATCVGPGGTALSDSTGAVTCDVRFGGVVGGPLPVTIDVGGFTSYSMLITVTPGSPASAQILSGNNQSGDRGATLPVALQAQVLDGSGHTLSGVPVTWQVVGSATLTSAGSVTNAQGAVSATVKLGYTPGPIQVKLLAGTAQAVFNLTVNPGVGSFVAVSGGGQTTFINQAFASPLVVALKDDTGQPISGAAVNFTVTSGAATVGTAATTTNSQGQASASVTAGATAGSVVITATSLGQSVTFSLTVAPPGPIISAANIRSAISGDLGVSPGGIIAIYGQGIAPGIEGSVVANDGYMLGPLPTKLAGVEVLFDTISAPIYHVNNINGQEFVVVQAPFTLAPGTTTSVTVKLNGIGTTVSGVSVKDYQPGIFETLGPVGQRWAVLTKADGSYVTADNPVVRGVTTRLRMYCAGLGQTIPALGTNFAGIPGQALVAKLILGVRTADGGIGGGVNVVSAETMVGVVGVYVVTFDVPATINAGLDQTLVVAIANADGSPNMNRIYYSAIPKVQ